MSANVRTPIEIGDNLTIYQVPQQKDRLLEALSASDALELDLSQVGEIDTAGLQLLLLVKREAMKAGKALTLSAHSPAVRELFEFTRLAGYFGDPMIIPRGD